MAFNALNNLFGGGQKSGDGASGTTPGADPDFADFASPSPTATQYGSSILQMGGTPYGRVDRPYTKWYRVWERVTIHDFYQELMILPILLVVVIVNIIGTRMNKAIIKTWASTYLPLLENEYALVGFGKEGGPSVSDVQSKGLARALEESGNDVPPELLKQKKKYEYFTYATGRQNVAWLDLKLSLYKRYNPFIWFMEAAISFFFESIPAPVERMEATAYVFDGREKQILPDAGNTGNSTYDGFIFAVVHKDKMKQLRDDRYDLSLTATRDHPKLPEWATVMSESAEITDSLMTSEFVKAIEQAGEDLEAIIISDQPVDAPKKLDDLVPRKRISLSLRLPSSSTASKTKPLFEYFLRLPDVLVNIAHFRPEAVKKIRGTREEEIRKIKKLDEGEKAEERKTATDKMKKEERDRKLKGMSAEEQRKFLEKEAASDRKRGMKRQAVRA